MLESIVLTRSARKVTARRLLAWGSLAIAATCATVAVADVYKVVDENGRITYTDAPPKGQRAEKVDIKDSNTLPRTRVTKRLSAEAENEPKDAIPDSYQITITNPPDDFHMTPGIRDLSVQVEVNPPIHPSHRLEITDNGAPVQGMTLENVVVRGAHRLQARVVDEQGRIISASAPVQFFVHRPTVAR